MLVMVLPSVVKTVVEPSVAMADPAAEEAEAARLEDSSAGLVTGVPLKTELPVAARDETVDPADDIEETALAQ